MVTFAPVPLLNLRDRSLIVVCTSKITRSLAHRSCHDSKILREMTMGDLGQVEVTGDQVHKLFT
jgi:hypothetical protein